MGGGRGPGGGPGGGCVLSADLLPCPWCVQRGERRLIGGGIVAIGCTWCGSTGPRAYGYDEARALWNANARSVSEAKAVLNDIADAIGDAGRLGESHGDTIRRLRAELGALRAPAGGAS